MNKFQVHSFSQSFYLDLFMNLDSHFKSKADSQNKLKNNFPNYLNTALRLINSQNTSCTFISVEIKN